MARQRFAMTMLGMFAAFAMLLAVVGIYGVMSHLVAQGSHDIGIRMALGRRPRRHSLDGPATGRGAHGRGGRRRTDRRGRADARHGESTVWRQRDGRDDVCDCPGDPDRRRRCLRRSFRRCVRLGWIRPLRCVRNECATVEKCLQLTYRGNVGFRRWALCHSSLPPARDASKWPSGSFGVC